MTVRIIILGAGPTGLGAAHRLLERAHADWLIFERNDHVGGLASSFIDDKGFTWDIGGHVLFSHYDHFDKIVTDALNGEYYEHLRESWIRILGTWVPYPFQNNIRHLPDGPRASCLEGLRNRAPVPSVSGNFREWMQATFGDGIVRYFMEPYNAKVWGVPLDFMSTAWLGERVSIVDRHRIEENIRLGRDDVSWGPNNRFRFPKQGGTGAIFEGIARPFRDRITFNKEAVQIDLQEKMVTFADGQRIRYDALINTSPLDKFIQCCVSVPGHIRDAADALAHNSGLIVGLGIAGTRIDPKCWMYFPETNAPFYRATNFFNYSPHNVPGGDVNSFFSLMSETTYSSHKFEEKRTIIERTVLGLTASGLLSEKETANTVSQMLIDIPYSYPVPTLGRDTALRVIQPFLEAHCVYSRGRFGAWKYEVGNMDHSFMQGVEVVDRILKEGNEPTVNGRPIA